MDSLVKLAEEKRLPAIQILDQETLGWIESNRPSFGQVSVPPKSILFVSRSELARFSPSEEWFGAKGMSAGIHGRRHLLRVVLHTRILAKLDGLDEPGVLIASVIALLHDIRRINDKGDVGHDQRASDWFKENSQLVAQKIGIQFTQEQKTLIAEALSGREGLDTPVRQYREYVETADALDRYRLPKRTWWIDESYLSIKPAGWHKKFAFDLVVSSEKNAFSGIDDLECIDAAVQELL